jgi:hypothetical protein
MARPSNQLRDAARATGARFYCGPPCKFGHGQGAGGVERYTSTGVCRLCVQGQARPDRAPGKPQGRARVSDPAAALLG